MLQCFFHILAFFCFSGALHAENTVRLKDIIAVEGVRSNQLVGYGLVVGLNNTGDTVGSTTFTRESLASMLERLGVNVRDNTGKAFLGGKNVAAVMVTASLPAFARQGSKIDVNVAALGDAKDLRGGTLLVTPLLAADNQVYAVAQGQIAVGGFKGEGNAVNVTKGVPTSGRIASGAIVETEVDFDLASLKEIKFSLNNPDFTTAKYVADAINNKFGVGAARPLDPSTIQVTVPQTYRDNVVGFMHIAEQLRVTPDQVARIIIDDHDGVIVMGANVRLSPVAISHGSVTIRIEEKPEVFQPNPFVASNPLTANFNANNADGDNVLPEQFALGQAGGAPTLLPDGSTAVVAPAPGTAVVARSDIKVIEETGKMTVLDPGSSLQTLVDGLNALGVTPREMITILHSIKAAGAIQADIEML